MAQTFYLDPTAVTNGSGSVGSPFNSLTNALSGILTASNAATEDYTIVCLAGADSAVDTALIAIDNTSSTARTLRIIASGANQHTGVRNTGYRHPNRIACNNNNTNVTVELSGIAMTEFVMDQAVAVTANLYGCAMFDAPNWAINCGGGTINAKNCVVVGATFEGVKAENNNGGATLNLVNCTVVGAGAQGVLAQFGGTVTAINCYSGNNTGADYQGVSSPTNCLSEDGSQSTSTAAYSTANFTSVTAASENLKLPSGSALIGAGVGPASNGSVPTTDFEGHTRSGTTTDVGFDLRAGTAGSASGDIGTVTISAPGGSASSARSVSVTLINGVGVPLNAVTRRFWTRSTLDAAAVDGGAGGLSVTSNSSGVFVLTGLNVGAGAGWLAYKDPADDLNCHIVPVTFI